jgi:type IV secretory pathway component VirB8
MVIDANKNHGRVKGTESKQLNRVQCELEFLQCFQITHLRYRIRNSSGKRVSVKISASIRKKHKRMHWVSHEPTHTHKKKLNMDENRKLTIEPRLVEAGMEDRR